MLTKNIFFKDFKNKKINKEIKKNLISLVQENNEIIKSLGTSYKNSYYKKTIQKLKKKSNFRIIGMGGSTLGSESIYSFLNDKIKKRFEFINNLEPKYSLSKKNM